MKVLILAGGRGTRLAEETDVRPKPLVEVGGRPLLWHLMKHYDAFGFSEFFVALGYKGELVKRYFLDYVSLSGSVEISLKDGKINPLETTREHWSVSLVDTGDETNTGGRLKRLAPWLRDETFMLTYGDGVCDIDLNRLLEFHRQHGRAATVTAVHPPSRFGEMIFQDDDTVRFTEKPLMGEGWINGGFMVLEPSVLDLIDGDSTSLEGDVLEQLSQEGQLAAYRHDSFWQCVDTLRELRYLQALWESGESTVGDVGVARTFWSGRTVLVTGAAGLLGGWVSRALADADATVIGLDIDWGRPSAVEERSGVTRVAGDVRDGTAVERLLGERGVDTVIHLAAQTLVGPGNDDPADTFDHNIRGAWTTLDACRRHRGLSSVVVASSDKAYGDHGASPYSEDMALARRASVRGFEDLHRRDRPNVREDLRHADHDHALREHVRGRRHRVEPDRPRDGSVDPGW